MTNSRIVNHYAPLGKGPTKSLFPDLHSLQPGFGRADAVNTALGQGLLETSAAEATVASESPVPQAARDIVVGTPPEAAIRDYLGKIQYGQSPSSKLISLIDPSRSLAALLIRMVSESGAQPTEQTHFRARHGLRTLATIEQTKMARPGGDTLLISHADLRTSGTGSFDIQAAMVERSQMAVILVGGQTQAELEALLHGLKASSSRGSWRCPSVLFVLPTNSTAAQLKIRATTWPQSLQVLTIEEPLGTPSAVWNTILTQWQIAKTQPSRIRDMGGSRPSFKLLLQPFEPTIKPRLVVTPELASSKLTLGKHERAKAAIGQLAALSGVLACAVVIEDNSQILAQESRLGHELDLQKAVVASVQLMRSHRETARVLGLARIEELTSSSGDRQIMLRPCSRRKGVFIMALLDKQRTNLTLSRLKLVEIDKQLI